jgi:hypothetical protein
MPARKSAYSAMACPERSRKEWRALIHPWTSRSAGMTFLGNIYHII